MSPSSGSRNEEAESREVPLLPKGRPGDDGGGNGRTQAAVLPAAGMFCVASPPREEGVESPKPPPGHTSNTWLSEDVAQRPPGPQTGALSVTPRPAALLPKHFSFTHTQMIPVELPSPNTWPLACLLWWFQNKNQDFWFLAEGS